VHFGFDLVEPGERFTVADWKEYTEQKICSIRERGHVPIVCGGTGLYIDALVFNYQFEKGDIEQNSCSESGKFEPDRQKMSSEYIVYGISWPSEELRNRLRARVNKLFVQELFDETRFLVENYGWGSQAMKSNIYQFAWGYLQSEYGLNEAKELFFYDDWHLAKRQMTWFKRNPNMKWLPLSKMKDEVLENFR
jgi:tRNA dimethylallyltransferase